MARERANVANCFRIMSNSLSRFLELLLQFFYLILLHIDQVLGTNGHVNKTVDLMGKPIDLPIEVLDFAFNLAW